MQHSGSSASPKFFWTGNFCSAFEWFSIVFGGFIYFLGLCTVLLLNRPVHPPGLCHTQSMPSSPVKAPIRTKAPIRHRKACENQAVDSHRQTRSISSPSKATNDEAMPNSSIKRWWQSQRQTSRMTELFWLGGFIDNGKQQRNNKTQTKSIAITPPCLRWWVYRINRQRLNS